MSLAMPLIVEFYGLAGCGKSTLAHATALSLRGEGCPVAEPGYDHQQRSIPRQHALRFAMGLCFFCQNPWRAGHGIRQVMRTRQRSANDGRAVISNWLYKAALMKRFLSQSKGGSDMCILDEGIVHALWSVCLRGSRPLDPEAILSSCPSVPFSWLLVRVDCERETLRGRLAARAERTGYRNRLLQDWGEGYETDLARQASAISAITGVIQERWKSGTVRTLSVRNDGFDATSEIARHIADWILRNR